eukprot:3100441-Pleurochrysis_carterae.AAC.3
MCVSERVARTAATAARCTYYPLPIASGTVLWLPNYCDAGLAMPRGAAAHRARSGRYTMTTNEAAARAIPECVPAAGWAHRKTSLPERHLAPRAEQNKPSRWPLLASRGGFIPQSCITSQEL